MAAHSSSEVVTGVHRILMPLGERINSCYAFVGERRVLLFDTALDGDISGSVGPYLRSIGRDVADVAVAVISHGDVDHFGGNAELHSLAPGTLIACHRGDLELISDPAFVLGTRYDELASEGLPEAPETAQWALDNARSAPVDLLLEGEEEFALGDDWAVRVLHVPGHSKGHLAIWDPRSKALVVSDAVLGDGVLLADGRPAFPPTYRWVPEYLDTIAACSALRPDVLLTAHYPRMGAAAAADFLALSRQFAERVDQAVVDFVTTRSAPSSVREVVLGIAAELGPWPMPAAATALGQPVIGHLEHLTDRGVLEIGTRDGIRRWGARR